jgi:hypothetical protein
VALIVMGDAVDRGEATDMDSPAIKEALSPFSPLCSRERDANSGVGRAEQWSSCIVFLHDLF